MVRRNNLFHTDVLCTRHDSSGSESALETKEQRKSHGRFSFGFTVTFLSLFGLGFLQ